MEANRYVTLAKELPTSRKPLLEDLEGGRVRLRNPWMIKMVKSGVMRPSLKFSGPLANGGQRPSLIVSQQLSREQTNSSSLQSDGRDQISLSSGSHSRKECSRIH